MAAIPSGAADLANVLLPLLVGDKHFELPDVDITLGDFLQPGLGEDTFPPVTAPTPDALLALFNQLMGALKTHIDTEFNENRITGSEYSKTYIAMLQGALQTAQQFLVQKDTARWQAELVRRQAQLAEIEKVKGRIELETARIGYAKARLDTLTAEIAYAVGKIKLSGEDIGYANLQKQGNLLDLQVEIGMLDKEAKVFGNTYILPLQKELLSEQVEVQRAQTLDVRRDGTVIVGTVGKQKDLYSQQITSYKRDVEIKVAKLYNDAWITQKTMDEGTLPPNQFTNVQLDNVLVLLRGNAGLGG